jgi:hypothetical protein
MYVSENKDFGPIQISEKLPTKMLLLHDVRQTFLWVAETSNFGLNIDYLGLVCKK